MYTCHRIWSVTDRIALGCLAGLALLPFFLPLEFHDAQRILTILLATVLLGKQLWEATWTPLTLTILAILATLGLIASSLSPAPLWSGVEFALLFTVFVLTQVLLRSVNEAFIQHIAITMFLIQGGYVLRHLWNYAEITLNGYPLNALAIIDGFSNLRFYGQFLVWTIPFCIAVLTTYKSTRWRFLAMNSLALSWSMAYLSGTRSFFIAMLASIVMTWWLTPTAWKRYVQWLLITAFLGMAYYAFLVLWLPEILNTPEPETLASYSVHRELTNSNGRLDIWLHALQQTGEHPWFGLGPMMTAETGFFKTEAHPHNYLIQWLSEWGIPFTLLLSLFLGYQLWRWCQVMQTHATERQLLALPAVASIGAAATAGLLDGLIVMPISLAYMTIMLGIAVSLQRTWTPDTYRIRLPVWANLILLMPSLALAGFTVYQLPRVVDAPFTLNPHTRFWTDGSLTFASQYAKTYEMGGASKSHTLAAVKLSVDLYPLLHQRQCQLHLGATEHAPDLTITCGTQREYIFINLNKKQVSVSTENYGDQQRSTQTFNETDTLTLATVQYSKAVHELLE
ncbi:MAG: hypothetical protein RL122_383 [Pseudomonadota bacterium]|jgi:O-antigen ligase